MTHQHLPAQAMPATGRRQPGTGQDGGTHARQWRVVNITPAERLGRVAAGVAGVIAGAILLAAAGSALAVLLEVLLVLAGADLLVTGALGHCPLYAKVGYSPSSLRRPR